MAVKTILITGATGAIGGALAKYYAKTGACLILQGRNAEKLQDIFARCTELGATVSCYTVDLSDSEARQNWLNKLPLPDLIIANAGMNIHASPGSPVETWSEIECLLDLNIKSTFSLINYFAPAMCKRGSGQVALVSSLAAYYGLPVTPSYCASKAAIKAYGEALRGSLAKHNIQVNVIMPGYVESDMAQAMPGPKPFIWQAERAATFIASGLSKNKPRISFPFPLNFGTWGLSVLPPSWSQKIVQLLGYDR